MTGGTKRCLGCGDRGSWGRSGRCRECLAAHKAKYSEAEYVIERARYRMLIDAGALLDCPRCCSPIEQGAPFDLGHQDDGSLHPEHPPCNRGARKGSDPLARYLLDLEL